jgi:hypothetical protein
MGSEHAWKLLAWSLSVATVATVSGSGCGSGGSDYCEPRDTCTMNGISVEVPNALASDIEDVQAEGQCEFAAIANGAPPAFVVFDVTGEGVCYIDFSSKTGCGFHAQVKITPLRSGCCAGTPEPENTMFVVPKTWDGGMTDTGTTDARPDGQADH